MEGVFLSVHLLFSRRSCTYDTLGRVTRSESGSAWVQYAYAEDRLSTITHSGGTNTAYNFAYTTGGLTGSVTVGSRQLVTNSYNPGTWTLSGQSYGNGQSWSYTYNNAGQITSRSDGTNTWRYYYNSEGALGRVERYSGQTKTGALRNYYDSADRLIRVVEQDGSGAVVHEYAWTYDSNDKVTSLTETVNGESFSYTYGYNGDMAALNMGGTAGRNFTYDGYGRLSRTDTDNILTTDYTYRTVNAGGTDYATTQIAAVQNTYAGAQHGFTYTYDNNGNILTVSDGTNTTSYSYDAQGQLVRENNQSAGKTWVWTYDSGGNILSRTEYAYTTESPGTAQTSASYTYGDTGWGDLLTAYNGQSISYDGIGNMTSYGGWSLGWSGGRRLSTMSRDGTSLLFAYNDEGQRTEKTVNGSTHKYLYRGGLLIADICGNDALYFRYDQNGEVIGFLRTLGTNRAEYRYVKNQQGDVVAVIDFAGAEAATYSYDGWGNILTTGGYDADLAARNPLRYRGYYYDSETELYYVTSRYYNPEMGRFICSDIAIGQIGNIQGSNLFAYCFSNPVNMSDPTGNWPKMSTVFAAVAVAAATVAAVAITVATCGAAVPALAVAGGGIISAGVATTVATGAIIVTGASTAVAVTSLVAEKTVERTTKRNNAVYVLRDDTGTVQYVGRTSNVNKRRTAHNANPDRAGLKMEVIASDLNLAESRALEQAGMVYYHTINTANRMNNQINSVSPKYWDAFKELALGTLNYGWNQMTNEILYWTGN